MLPTAHRLRRDRDIRGVLRGGSRQRQLPFDARIGRAGRTARFAFIISTKVSKSAVVRNKIRRRLRALVAGRLASFPKRDYVIIVRPEAAAMNSRVLRDQAIRLFTNLSLSSATSQK